MRMPWDIQSNNGVWLPQADWRLDAPRACVRSFVSHAHFDHIARHGEIICTEATARLMKTRLPARRSEHRLAYGQTERLTRDISVTLHPAGHVLGSAQILLEHAEHGRLLYTGDFKLKPSRAAEPCATPKADVLVMETTFGRSHYVLPPAEKVMADIADFCLATLSGGGTPVLYAYSLGKSQELLAGLSGAFPVMLHKRAAEITRVYEELGAALPPWTDLDPAKAAGHVVIAPPQGRASPLLNALPRPRTAMITGWALDPGSVYRYRCNAAYPLSDHADFADLLDFVERVNPSKVFTLHGFAEDFARTLRARGRDALALGGANQLDLELTGSGG